MLLKHFDRALQFCGTAGITIGCLGSTLFHLYTAFIAFEIAGLVGGLLTFITPVFAELYWAWHISNQAGALLSRYTGLLLLIAICFALGAIALFAAAMAEHRRREFPAGSPDDTPNQ